jgi:hypothetical protein
MSELRKHLQQAKQQYESLRYTGDLAADVLPKPTVNWSLRLIAAAGALAAAAVVVVALWTSFIPPAKDDVAQVDDADVIDIADVIEEEPAEEPVSFAVQDIPQAPEIGPLWTNDDPDTQWAPTFPSLEEVTASEATSTETRT